MDGHSRTCVEWMCNDEYEPNSFDLNNIMSPPDHESMFFSLINANPLAEEEDTSCAQQVASSAQRLTAGLASAGAAPLAALATPDTADAPLLVPAGESLVTLVQQLNLRADVTASPDRPSLADTGAATTAAATTPSLVEAVSEALAASSDTAAASTSGLSRISSATHLSSLAHTGGRHNVERRMSTSAPNSPPQQRRAHAFFTESVFDAARPAAICRAWQQQQERAAASAQPAASLASIGEGSLDVPDASAAAPNTRSARVRPRPSRLRELNFMAPTSM